MVIVDYGHTEAGMDGFLKDNLDLYKKMVRNSRDLVFVVSGKEREGKSVLANSILAYLDPTYHKDVNRCCFNGEEFLKQVKKAKNFQAICFDEAQEFTSRGSLTKFNRILIQALSMIGMKQLYIAIVLPAFFELDKYPAIHRSNFLMRVYSHKGTRGFFEFWNWEKKKRLYLLGKKTYDYFAVAPNFRGRFYDKCFPFREEYNKKKLRAIENMNISFRDLTTKQKKQRDHLIIYLYNVIGLTMIEISKLMEESGEPLSRQAISEIIGENT